MIRTIKVYTSDLEAGMYVSALDRPWLDTPFPIQGFVIESQEDIDRLRHYCNHVYVDKFRSHRFVYVDKQRGHSGPWWRVTRTVHVVDHDRSASERPREPIAKIFNGRKLKRYAENTGWLEEHATAHVALDSLMVDIVDMFEEVRRGESTTLM